MEVDNMYTGSPYYRKEQNHSIRKMIQESMIADVISPAARFKTRYIRNLDDEILRIARGYQQLNRLYNPVNGSNIQYARDI